MKKYVVSVITGLVLVALAWPVFAQAEKEKARDAAAPRSGERAGGGFGAMTEEERAKMREKFQSMSEEEKEKFRTQMRERAQVGREEQLKAIAQIQEQLGKLKAAVESGERPEGQSLRDLPQEERAKLREKMAASFQERQKALTIIEQELSKLRGGRGFGAQDMLDQRQRLVAARQQASIAQLKVLHAQAVKEKATETAKGLEKLIAEQSAELEKGTTPRPEGEQGTRTRTRSSDKPAAEGSGQTTRPRGGAAGTRTR